MNEYIFFALSLNFGGMRLIIFLIGWPLGKQLAQSMLAFDGTNLERGLRLDRLGAALSTDIVNPVTVLVTKDEINALAWVPENTPEDARFYINTAHWQSGMYRSVDGGGWDLPYAERWSLVPTVFYGISPDVDCVR